MEAHTLIKDKVGQAIAILREFNVDCWITFARETVLNGDPVLDYLVTGDLTWQSAIILSSSGKTCAIVGQYDTQSISDIGAYDAVIGFVEGFRKPFVEYMATLKPRTIAVNYSKESEVCDGITHGMYLTLVDLLRELHLEDRIISAEEIISALRQRKTGRELASIKEAVRHTEEIFLLVGDFIRPGVTEQQIASFMHRELERRGLGPGWEAATCPAVFTGPDAAGAHYSPTTRQVQPGHLVNLDFGVMCERYVSDQQRTFYVLREGESSAPREVQQGFDVVVRAIESSRRAMKPGVRGVDVDAVARGITTTAGYDQFAHGLGHQVGRSVHDGTALLGPAWEKYGRKPFVPLEEGMVFTLEPRVTIPGHGIATLEEMVVVTSGGAEYLTRPESQLLLIHP
jgi:Xaa-Pro aminopeptidase